MPIQQSFQVAGVDGCKAGWLVAVVSATQVSAGAGATWIYKLQELWVATTFGEILLRTTNFELVCIDIPIGLSDGPPRDCDSLARCTLRPFRSSSVFVTPIRPCLSADEYKAANVICRRFSGQGLSRQSFALLHKIRQVDDLMTPSLQLRVREIHPEVSFWALNYKKPIQQNKKTVPGQAQRHRLLQGIFSDMEGVLAEAPPHGYAMDDALDALVAAWTAGQAVIGKAKTLPENPPLDSKGLKMEMLYPVCYNQ
jgi:predicted RNase H-like nuclease